MSYLKQLLKLGEKIKPGSPFRVKVKKLDGCGSWKIAICTCNRENSLESEFQTMVRESRRRGST